jgi:hypothetical protein
MTTTIETTATVTETTATCTRCNQALPIDAFRRQVARPGRLGRTTWCKGCYKAHAEERSIQRAAALRSFTFGVEIEVVGIDRARAAEAVRSVVGGSVRFAGGHYDKREVVAADGRVWTAMTDGSLSSQYSAEIVTPICTYGDLETVQKVARALRAAGARVDGSCGIHVHVGADKIGAKGCANLVKLVWAHEDAMRRSLEVAPSRARYCAEVPASLVARVREAAPASLDALATVWYGRSSNEYERAQRYNGTRYHGINLHSVFYRGTVEFRLFNGTLHAGKIKSYVQLCLGMAARAASARTAAAKRYDGSVKTMRRLLRESGLEGVEFKTARGFLLAAWK